MLNPETAPDKRRYMISERTDEGALAQFLIGLRNEPDIDLVDTLGPAGHPHTVVVALTPATARVLEQRFRDSQQLLIELDRPLSLFK